MSTNDKKIMKKITSPIRPEKLEEGQKALDAMGQIPFLERIFNLFKDRKTVESGFSIRELALLFFPKQSRSNPKTGTKEPTIEAINKINTLLNMFRKGIGNRSIALYTNQLLTHIEGNIEFYDSVLHRNISYKDFTEPKKRMKKESDGLLESIETGIEIVTTPEEELLERDKILEATLRNQRNRKRKYDDYDPSEDIY